MAALVTASGRVCERRLLVLGRSGSSMAIGRGGERYRSCQQEYKKLMRLHYADRGKRTARAKIVKGI